MKTVYALLAIGVAIAANVSPASAVTAATKAGTKVCYVVWPDHNSAWVPAGTAWSVDACNQTALKNDEWPSKNTNDYSGRFGEAACFYNDGTIGKAAAPGDIPSPNCGW
jgi:hypothetical protein